jgi:hypothetical protein
MSEQRIARGIETGDDKGRSETAEKDQDHDRGKTGCNDAFAHHSADGAAHEDRLIGERSYFELRRQLPPHARAVDNVADVLDDVEC